MPQLDRFIFFSQFFWSVFFFFSFYFYLIFCFLPWTLRILIFRKRGISAFLFSKFDLDGSVSMARGVEFFYFELADRIGVFFSELKFLPLFFKLESKFFFRRYGSKFSRHMFYLPEGIDGSIYYLCSYFFYRFLSGLFRSGFGSFFSPFLVVRLNYYLSQCFYFFYRVFFFRFLKFYYRNFPNTVHVDKMAFDWLFRLLRRLNSYRLIKIAFERRLFYINSLALYIDYNFELSESMVPVDYESRVFHSKLAVDLKNYVPFYFYVYDYFSHKGFLQSVFIWRRFFNGREELIEK